VAVAVLCAVVALAAGGAVGLVRAGLARQIPLIGWLAGPVRPQTGSMPVPASAPTRVRIPAIGVDSPLETLHLDGSGELAAPLDFGQAGWFADGTVPGEVGPAVIAGHVDSVRGKAIFYNLGKLRAGDFVEVQRGDRWLRFQVTGVDRYAKKQFPTGRVYGPTPDAQLRLITCGGSFDRSAGSYVDNVVVYATVVRQVGEVFN
jgi:LPXTG-site transpeptidase (sortase) family protein